jgi:polar amino acid transport system substrate-binding protein
LAPIAFGDVESALVALSRGDLKAVVYDSPILRYHVAANPSSKLQFAGDRFDLQNYGFALQLGSIYRKSINEALLKLQVAGFRDELEKKWFAGIGK